MIGLGVQPVRAAAHVPQPTEEYPAADPWNVRRSAATYTHGRTKVLPGESDRSAPHELIALKA